MPSAASCRIFWTAADGVENSTAASTPRRFSRVRPAPRAFVPLFSAKRTAKPYSGASCSIRRPIAQVLLCNTFLGGVRHVNAAWTNQKRRAPCFLQGRDVGGERHHACRQAVERGKVKHRRVQDFADFHSSG